MPDERPLTVNPPASDPDLEPTRRTCLDRLAGAVAALDAGQAEAVRLLPADTRAMVEGQIEALRARLMTAIGSVREATTTAAVVDAYRVGVGETMQTVGGFISTAGQLLASPGYAYRKEVGAAIGTTVRAVGSMVGDVLGAAASASGLATLALVALGVWALSQHSGKRASE